MKKVLFSLIAPLSLLAPPLTIRFQNRHPNHFPAPIKTHTDLLKRYVPSPWLRMAIMGTAFGICATDNEWRKKLLVNMNKIQQSFNKANEVTNRAYILEQNMRSWINSFYSVAFE